jgi:hypothetical protein
VKIAWRVVFKFLSGAALAGSIAGRRDSARAGHDEKPREGACSSTAELSEVGATIEGRWQRHEALAR